LFARHRFSLAGLLLAAISAHGQDLLDPEVAFRVTATLIKTNLIEVRYQTAPGYYLYRDRLAYALEPAQAHLGRPKLPAGKTKHDAFFGKQVIYRNLTRVTLPFAAAVDMPLTLTADLQGCADLGVCYPPVRRKFALSLPPSPAK
jgi:thiol:disulfide interchange protein DsbD